MKLGYARFRDARAFLMKHGRGLEQRLFEHSFEGGTGESVLGALSYYQNEDGGFGRGLEPDIRMEGSSVIATTVGLQALREVKAPGDHLMVQRAVRYLLTAYDPEREVWPIVPKGVDDAPHAPWWNHEQTAETFNGFLANPRAEVVGYFYDYAGLVPADLLAKLTAAVLAHLETLPDQMDMYDMLCYIRLAETERLPKPVKDRVWKKLTRAAPRTVTRDPDKWGSFSVKPLYLAPSPDSPLFEVLKKDVEANLDFEIEHQNEDGSWSPFWSWGKLHPEAWKEAEREWKGLLTLKTLKSLRDFGRVEGI
jgi:hypothetical protein